jgi:hypothetical protein
MGIPLPEILNRHQLKGISMSIALRMLVISILVLMYDRVEFLYYGMNPDSKICLLIGERCFRSDSFIYYASVRVQYIILAVILQMMVPLFVKGLNKALAFLLLANVLYFIEYFFTYNEPLYKIPMLIGDWYLPVSVATVKLAAVIYLMYKCIMKIGEE